MQNYAEFAFPWQNVFSATILHLKVNIMSEQTKGLARSTCNLYLEVNCTASTCPEFFLIRAKDEFVFLLRTLQLLEANKKYPVIFQPK